MLDDQRSTADPGGWRGFPARVAIVYAAVGLAWIAGSGAVADWIARSTGVALAELELVKGIGFVLVTAAALFVILLVEQRRLHRAAAVRERLEAELRQAQKLEAVGRLASGIAHDFNNLLTAISGNAHLVRSDLATGSASVADVDEVIAAANRARDLVSQLLAFSRRRPAEPRTVAVDPALDALAPMLRRLVPAHVVIDTRLAAPGAAVRIDPIELDQIVLNLVVNAVDAMPHGGQLTISTESIGDRVRLTVRDTGVGMDEATRSRVFEPFFTTKPIGQGTGLGLSTVFGITQRAGGTIVVDSTPGRGTTFAIEIGVVELAAGAEPDDEPDGQGVRAARIVLVEDDPAVRDLADRVLSRAGHHVVSAATPTDALDLVASDSVDLLLTDVVMPELSGGALAARARAIRPDLRVLYMSGHADHAGTEAPEIGRTDSFIRKPFAPRELVDAVHRTLDA
ncbi:MAG TPA: ATP-binding protein [Candidatus Limnocylindrales bacterium]|nr:ATP-binding protein [Candidatus Limnocylindrales bacterium]